ncbi:signal peptidase I [Gallaecimonas kandeliae]|uniref:signal peptidase I n=1 Tax=Gallaecimonas kandeliae TaxID=3029055 RepID=UPI002649AC90|nr:signal peptidase I [Gallaecimonas kandeliae]WKE66422.1 signal peptidase I [Gallaecimonas kandeliae]
MAQYFSILLVLITLGTGLVWALDRWLLAPRRRAALARAEASAGGDLDQASRNKLLAEPGWVESCRGAFPVIAAVLVLRSFIFEPFQIPSGSMMPTLLVGDFILVEKFAYGLKDPVFAKKFLKTGEPKRGDIFVFKYPEDPSVDYIKRVVGLPGDRIIYRNKHLYIQPACQEGQSPCPGLTEVGSVDKGRGEFSLGNFPQDRRTETLGDVKHDILLAPVFPDRVGDYYNQPGTRPDEWIVPAGHYFAMGDNRDNSRDSRFWGFVPEANLVGKAVFIWMSFDMDRSPDSWLPNWVPTGVRFGRLGPIH